MPRKSNKGTHFFASLFNPLHKAIEATGNSAKIVGKQAGKITKNTLKAVNNVGMTYSRAANSAASKLISNKNSRSKSKNRKTRRKTRRSNRR